MVLWKLTDLHETIVSATETSSKNGVHSLLKMVFKNPFFCQKAENFV